MEPAELTTARRPRPSDDLPGPSEAVLLLQVTGSVLLCIAAAALVTAAGFAAPARHALRFGFGGAEHTLTDAREILLHNVRAMGMIAAAVMIVQALRLERPDAPLGRTARWVRTGVDVALGAAVAVNAGVVGVSVGAYGWRMVKALMPHGPVELAAFVVALTVYLRARRAPLRGRDAAVAALLAASSVVLLAVAALLEAYAPY